MWLFLCLFLCSPFDAALHILYRRLRIHDSLGAINGALIDGAEEKAGEQTPYHNRDDEEAKESVDPDNQYRPSLAPPPPPPASPGFHYVDALSMLIMNSSRPDDSSTVLSDNSHMYADCQEGAPCDGTVRTELTVRTQASDPTVYTTYTAHTAHSMPTPSPSSVESEIPPPPQWPPSSPTLTFEDPSGAEVDENVGRIRRISSRRSPRSPSVANLLNSSSGSPSQFVRPKAI